MSDKPFDRLGKPLELDAPPALEISERKRWRLSDEAYRRIAAIEANIREARLAGRHIFFR